MASVGHDQSRRIIDTVLTHSLANGIKTVNDASASIGIASRVGNVRFKEPEASQNVSLNPSPATLERPVPRRRTSNISMDSASSANEHLPQDCSDVNCTFGWTTYVCNHDPSVPVSTWSPRISIHSLLHENDNNPLLEAHGEGIIRYVHLPANNMYWIEGLMTRYYHGKDNSKCPRILGRHYWYGQQHGPRGPVHARFMRPRCDALSGSSGSTRTDTDFVIAMPYLHWETDQAREKMHKVVESILESKPQTPSSSDEALPEDTDENLLRAHLEEERPLHIRRTLDQSYYTTLKDTRIRDQDQVVYRATVKPSPNSNTKQPCLVMVDQLWIWILDGNMVVSSFPRRWGRMKRDSSGVYRSIRDRLDDRPKLDDPYNMATMIMDQCSRVFFDHTLPRDDRPEVMDIFANAIGVVTDKSTHAYTKFWDVVKPKNGVVTKEVEMSEGHKRMLESLLDIGHEGELLKEIKDILDELHMMIKVYNDQHTVVEEFSNHLQQLKNIPDKTRNDAARLLKEIFKRKLELDELTRSAERTADGLKELLDLKQKHANVAVARETNTILEYTSKLASESAEQTIQGGKQNRSLMIFTIVTIIFLPLGFFSSVFGMNAPEFGQGEFHIWKQFLIMFPISIAVIILSLFLALSEDVLNMFSTTLQLWWANFLRRFGLLDRWKRRGRTIRKVAKRKQDILIELYKEPTITQVV